MQFALLADDVLTSVSSQKIIERAIRIVAVGRNLETEAVYVAYALITQLFLDRLEKIVESVPGSRDVFDRVAGLLDQRTPYMVGRHSGGIRHPIKAAALLGPVVAINREKRGFGVLLLLGGHDIADVDQLV